MATVQSWARVASGIVQEVWNDVPAGMAPGFDPNNEFLPIPGSVWVECPPEVQPNWTYDGTTFAAPVDDPYAGEPPPCTKRQVLLGINSESTKVEDDVLALIEAQFPGDYDMQMHWAYPDNNRFVFNEPLVVQMDLAGFFGAKGAKLAFWEASQNVEPLAMAQLERMTVGAL